MIAESSVPDLEVCAGLFFRGILPSFEDFIKFDPEAARILGSSKGSIQFTNSAGDSAYLHVEDGQVRWGSSAKDEPVILIGLGSVENTVRFIRGGFALPIVYRGWSRPIYLFRLLRLFLRFQSLLKPKGKSLEDPAFRILHVRLALATALFSIAEIGRGDSWARTILEQCPNGTVSFLVDGEDLAATIEKTGDGLIPRRGLEREIRADAVVKFSSAKVAMEILTRKTDAHAGVALGSVQVEGLIPLADGIGHVLDRVGRYLPS
ncbi:MAG: hypothetical protein AAGJ81_02790 [Verrucomicrobiota bacterium]